MELTVHVGFEELLHLIQQLPSEKKLLIKALLDSSRTEAPVSITERPLGSMKGLVTYIADDFDEPLEDFKEYM